MDQETEEFLADFRKKLQAYDAEHPSSDPVRLIKDYFAKRRPRSIETESEFAFDCRLDSFEQGRREALEHFKQTGKVFPHIIKAMKK